ncbi:NmrA family NAD(P)-binding protein [Pedobacter sp. Du54]|uniref:NmrA family NAD(P)-binding protein n=1 Tax=Pedobacter anseongensis TaxID=3133439 RepID=UPI0030AC3F39
MNITITGSLGNISKPLTKKLVKAGHNVKVITSNETKRNEIEALGATPSVGSIDDVAFLSAAFKGADAIYTMTPNNFSATDQRAYMVNVGKSYAEAITTARVKKVINLSSIGANLTDGTGPIKGLHDIENILNNLEGVNIKHLRAAYFYTNFYNDIALIKNLGFTGSNYDGNTPMVLVHPKDIASQIAKQVETGFEGKSIRYVYSDEQTASAVATTLGNAVNQPNLPWIQFTDQQLLDGMLQAGLPEAVAKNYVEMGQAMGSGLLNADFNLNKPEAGETKLIQFAKEFATKFEE